MTPERIDPYDLGSVGKFMERDRVRREIQLDAAHAEVERRIQRIKSMGGSVNPYDLDQMAHIFEPVNAIYRSQFRFRS